jgi:ABC-type branched-subunit amino acid transport system ATPase component
MNGMTHFESYEGEIILKAIGLTKVFKRYAAVNNVSFFLKNGEIIGIIGPNGSGKTTLLNLLSGIMLPDSGRIIYQGLDITRMPAHERANRGIIRSYQIPRVFSELTVLENMIAPILPKLKTYSSSPEIVEKAKRILEVIGLKDKSNTIAEKLSVGQKRMLELGRILMLDPKVVMLDEPTAGIHPLMIKSVLELLLSIHREKNRSLIIVEHNIKFIKAIAHRIIVMSSGQIIYEGSPDDALKDSRVVELYIGHVSEPR